MILMDASKFKTISGVFRLDLIWLLRDEKSIERDKVIAKLIYELHSVSV